MHVLTLCVWLNYRVTELYLVQLLQVHNVFPKDEVVIEGPGQHKHCW